MPLREYSGSARQTTLVGDITSGSTQFTVVDATGYPTGATAPFVVVIDRGVASEEKILVTSRSGNTFTVSQRGFDGTTPAAHLNGIKVEHVLDATTVREVNAHAHATGVAHGVDFTTLVSDADLAAYATNASLTVHEADTTAVHGIADTARLALVTAGGKFTAPVVKETVAPAATDAASTQTLVNSLRTALINLGLAQ